MARIFIALWPDPQVRGALAEWRDDWTWPRTATPVRTERLHVTLHFLGELPQERLADLGQALRVPFQPFTLAFGHPELWPHGVAVLEPDAIPPALTALHADLTDALQRIGLACDTRPYRPHVTMARRAANAGIASKRPPIAWQVDAYHLMAATGDGYTSLQSFTP